MTTTNQETPVQSVPDTKAMPVQASSRGNAPNVPAGDPVVVEGLVGAIQKVVRGEKKRRGKHDGQADDTLVAQGDLQEISDAGGDDHVADSITLARADDAQLQSAECVDSGRQSGSDTQPSSSAQSADGDSIVRCVYEPKSVEGTTDIGGDTAKLGGAADVSEGTPAGSVWDSDYALPLLLLGGVGVAAAAVAGGGGGGGSSSGASTTTGSTTVAGTVTLGPVIQGLKVAAYDTSGNLLGSSDVTSGTGAYSINIGTYGGGVLLKVLDQNASSGNYLDEATSTSSSVLKDLGSAVVRAAAAVTAAGTTSQTITVNLSALTELAVQEMGLATGSTSAPSDTTAIQTVNKAIANMFVGSTEAAGKEITALTPNTVINASGADSVASSNVYGLVLSAISGMEASSTLAGGSTTLEQVIAWLNSQVTDVSKGASATFADQGATAQTALKQAIASGAIVADGNSAYALDYNSTVISQAAADGVIDSMSTPFVKALSTATLTAKSGTTVGFNVTFSENVAISGTPTITVLINGTSVTATYNATATSALGNASIAVFDAVLPSTADGSSVILSALPSSGITAVDNGAALYSGITGMTTSALTIDNTAPTVTTTTYSAAENQTAVATLAASESVTWTLGSGGDTSLFGLTSGGVLTFAGAPNYEDAHGPAYTVNVVGTDAAGNATTQAITVNVTNVNEAPTASGTVSAQTAVNGQSTWSLDLSSYFTDVDAGDTRSYTLSSGTLPTGLTLNSTTGVISGTPTVDSSAANVTITMTDSSGLTATQTFSLGVVSAPTISSITASTAAAKSGTALTFTVTMSEAVTISGGTPTLAIEVNGTPFTATYTGGSGSNTLTFTATAPTGNDAAITVQSISLGGATVTGQTSGQGWLTSTVGQQVASFVIDNTAPTVTTTTYSAAENQTAVATLAASESVTWTLGSGGDTSLFGLTSGGVLTFAGAPNYEDAHGPAYTVNVVGTDAAGNATTQAITVNVTNVNEAPTASGTVSAQTAVNGQSTWSLDLSSYFTDVDTGDTASYSLTSGTLPTGLTLNASTGVISGTPTVDSTAANYTVTMTDSGGLMATQTFSLGVISAPTLSSNVDGVSNLDVRSNLVMTSSESVGITTADGTYTITIVNDANDTSKAGFHTETTTHTQTITVTVASGVASYSGGSVTISGNVISLDPTYDLDISNNYHIEVSAGLFVGITSGMSSVAISDSTSMNFSTVTPGTHGTGTVATEAVESQVMTSAGAIVAGAKWLDIEGNSNNTGSPKELGSLAGDDYVFTFKTYTALVGGATTMSDGVETYDFNVHATDFGSDDKIYVDSQFNSAASSYNKDYTQVLDGGSNGGNTGDSTIAFGLVSSPVQNGSGAYITTSIEGNTDNTLYADLNEMMADAGWTSSPVIMA